MVTEHPHGTHRLPNLHSFFQQFTINGVLAPFAAQLGQVPPDNRIPHLEVSWVAPRRQAVAMITVTTYMAWTEQECGQSGGFAPAGQCSYPPIEVLIDEGVLETRVNPCQSTLLVH
jgi:hypothetical protein